MPHNPADFSTPELITTNDGSTSLYLPALQETYHSRHGAYQESVYVYITHGLHAWHGKYPTAQTVRVLELGFGTGLNALLAYYWTKSHGVTLHYTTLEPYPVPAELVAALSYADPDGMLGKLHAADWEVELGISPWFTLHKLQTTIEAYTPTPKGADVVFYDAFGPNKQAEVWAPENLIKCHEALAEGGLLTTYCAQGQFRRDLVAAGFSMTKLQGPPFKKEMTQGWKLKH
jgi:tRNA U34 5-methylaminomethyl-2-thiouridine-forming methyltransferase MnmC